MLGWCVLALAQVFAQAPDSLKARPVTVGIIVAAPSISVNAWGTEADGVRLDDGKYTARRRGDGVVLCDADGRTVAEGDSIILKDAGGRGVTVGRWCVRTEVDLIPEKRGLTAVNRLDLEDYLKGVVPGEIGRHLAASKAAAVQAQAVVARTYALRRLQMVPPTRRYALVATVADQVYGGRQVEDSLCTASVEATRGVYVSDGNGPIDAYYHSASGGRTAAIRDIWPRKPDRPYLGGIIDSGDSGAWCRQAVRVYRWTETWDTAALYRVVARYLPEALEKRMRQPVVTGISTEGRDSSGRVRQLIVTTASGDTFTVVSDRIRWALRRNTPNRDILRSSRFELTREDGHFVIRGSGNGHGVGMDQWGAMGRSQAGQDCATILGAYYPGTHLETLAE